MTCEELIRSYLAELEQNISCSVQPNGRLCVVTPYLYPDHDCIEIFIRDKASDLVVVSDLGETLRRLDTLGMDVYDTPKLLILVEQITKGLGAVLQDGVIRKEGPRKEVGKIAFAVLSACKDVGDLIYKSRAYALASFEEQVYRYLDNNDVSAERDVKIRGQSGTPYKVAFRVQASGKPALLDTLSPSTKGGVRGVVNAKVRMWYDINGEYAGSERKISLLNDEAVRFKDEELRLLRSLSTVHRWTERQALLSTLQGGPVRP